MNKLVKGSVAAAAGIALLMGGAGSLALWNDTADIANESVDSGNLTLTTSAGSWTNAPAIWVPGDESTYTATVTVVATGDNIEADLTIDTLALAGGDAELLADLDIEFVVTGTLPTGVTGSAGSYTIGQAGTFVLPVTITVEFDEGSDNLTQNQSVDLEGLEFVLEQVAP